MGARPIPASSGAQSGVPIGIGWRQPHYRDLLERLPALDFLEVHSENFFAEGGAARATLLRGREDYGISLHGVGLSLGSVQGLDPWHLDRLERLVRAVEPLRVSDHACFARGSLSGVQVHASDLLPIPFSVEALDVLCRNVEQVQERLMRPLVVENISAYLSWGCPDDDPAMLETEFLQALVRRTGCALLVDVNNIYVNALNARLLAPDGQPGRDPLGRCMAWIDSLAPGMVAQLHLAGHCHAQGTEGAIVIDDHGSRVSEPVWALYQHALQRFGPVPTLIEWDTDVPALDVLLQEAARARQTASLEPTR